MKLAILYKTDEYIDHNKVNIREQIEDLFEDTSNFELREYTDEKSMHEILKDVLKLDGIGLTMCNIWETHDTIYACYFIDSTEEKYINNTNNITFNHFGSQIALQNVTSHLIIVKLQVTYSIIDKNVKTNTVHDTITQYELVNVIENIFVKNGVIIDIDGNMSSYKYIVNPLEHLMLTDNKYNEHYIYHEYEIFTHIMVVIVDVRETNGTINKLGTLLCGKPVNGTIFIGLYRKPEFNENPPYIDLSIDRLKNILSIRQKDCTLTTNFVNSDREYINFDNLLKIKKNEYKTLKTINISNITGELLNSSIKKSE